MRWTPLLLLALVVSACDTGSPAASSPPSLIALASVQGETDGPYAISEEMQLHAEGDMLVLQVNGKTLEFTAGQAYLVGQALSRGGYELLDAELAAATRPPKGGGDRCEPPSPGSAMVAVDGWLYGPGKCPPPPPPPFMDPGLLEALLSGSPAEIVELPEGAPTEDMLGGGFRAPMEF